MYGRRASRCDAPLAARVQLRHGLHSNRISRTFPRAVQSAIGGPIHARFATARRTRPKRKLICPHCNKHVGQLESAVGIEPTTYSLEGCRSANLSYTDGAGLDSHSVRSGN